MSSCRWFTNCHLTYNVKTDKIEICKCCIKTCSPFAEIPLFEFLNSKNIVEYLNKNFIDKFDVDTNFYPEFCERFTTQKECVCTEKLTQFNSFDVGIDVSCNMNCDFCYNKDFISFARLHHKTAFAKYVYFYVLNNILENASYPIKIRLTDHGEPFFWKKETLEFLEKAEKNPNILRIDAVTNGLALCDENFSSKIKKFSKLQINVSLNALNRERYLQVMHVDIFDKLIDRIRSLNQIVTLSYVVVDENSYQDFKNNLVSFREKVSQPIGLNSIDVEATTKIREEFKNYNIY